MMPRIGKERKIKVCNFENNQRFGPEEIIMFAKHLMNSLCVLLITAAMAWGYTVVDFEDLTLPGSESSWSGSYPVDGTGGTGEVTGFTSRGVSLSNFSDGDWHMWEGFAYSNMSDTTTPGYTNQFSAYTGTGYDAGDDIYAVGYGGFGTVGPMVTFGAPTSLLGAYFTNTTYAALAMFNGEPPANKFGGTTGNDPDWFMLTITGKDAAGAVTNWVDFYLADYRFANNSLDYIVGTWQFVDLTRLGTVKSIEFSFGSSDIGAYGINTPTYFAMDNLIMVPEPATLALLALGGLLIRKLRA
jgi:hypothetical protein